MASHPATHTLVVVWALADAKQPEGSAELVAAIEAQRQIPGVRTLRHGPRSCGADWQGADTAFGYGMVLTFDSFDAARAYVPHPVHQGLVATILSLGSRVSDIRGFWLGS